MHRDLTRDSYAVRIDRVLAYIAEDLDRRHSLEDLAAVACFSPYHFHRVYHAIKGETVEETVRRLRLHRAAADLNSTALPLERVASRAGYGSVAAFTRAFKADYGRPPATYRRLRCSDLAGLKPHMQELAVYAIEIGETPEFRLVGLDHKGDYNTIGTTFDRVSAMAFAKGLFRPDTRMFGIYFDDPDTVPPDRLRSFAGLTVSPDHVADKDLRGEVIRPGPTASLVHKGPYAELNKAYRYLYREWLPTSGREPGDRPAFEEYLNSPRDFPPSEWLTKVNIPLA